MQRDFREILPRDAHHLILNHHYARRLPSISRAFGLFVDGRLEGAVTFGSPASPYVSISLTGKRNGVVELNRLVLLSNRKNDASWLISRALKALPKGTVVVSYADEGQGHKGYVYQACNFLYGGCSKPRTDIYAGDGKHPRHHKGDRSIRVHRTPKHRYWTVCGGTKSKATILWVPQPYPK